MKLRILILAACAGAAGAATNNYSACFVPGEVTEYKVSWMKLPLAWSRTETKLIDFEGQQRIQIRMVSQTYKAYKHIYDVDDVTEVILDPVTALPLQQDVVINEGTIHKSHFTRFDHARGTALHIDRISHTTNSVALPPGTQDILSFLYAARARDLNIMKELVHTIYVEGKMYELAIQLHEDKGINIARVGEVPCQKIEPHAEFDGLFLRQGKIFFWVSKQKRRMVTLIEAKVPVGKIKVKLMNVSGPGDDFWIQKEKDE